jgi:hypothetical protein
VARTILLFHIISARPSKQPLMVCTFLKVYMELGSYFLFLQEQIKDIIIICLLPEIVAPHQRTLHQEGEKDERCFEKRDLSSHMPRLQFHTSGLPPSVRGPRGLEGHWGENAAWCIGHGSPAQEGGCHRPLAQSSTSCSAVV